VTSRLLVYDAEPAWARRAAALVEGQIDGLELVPWQTAGVQSLLRAQFDEEPFVFLAVDLDCGIVHAGSETVGQLLREWGAPDTVAALFERAYRVAADPVGRRLHGREPADIDGTFSLDETAARHAESLHRTCRSPACTNRV
jgi:hypothetical protein